MHNNKVYFLRHYYHARKTASEMLAPWASYHVGNSINAEAGRESVLISAE